MLHNLYIDKEDFTMCYYPSNKTDPNLKQITGVKRMPKPDNRKDNVAHLQNAVQDTIENFREAKEYLNEFGEEISSSEKEQILEKNNRRKKSIDGFRDEIKDEANYQRGE